MIYNESMPFQMSHFSLLQIIEWLINTDTYACDAMAMFALNALDEAIVHGRLEYTLRVRVENVTFEIKLFWEIVVKLCQFWVFWNKDGIKL